MLSKLALRNVKRSARDYLVYFLTMTFVVSLMLAFDSILFSEDLGKQYGEVDIMGAMIWVATVFILFIVAWLIHYMVRFILERRSREFAVYLLLGMKRGQIRRLWFRENLILGAIAFAVGIPFGALLLQILMSILYNMLKLHYRFDAGIGKNSILMTALCYLGCYLLALLRSAGRFRRMNISHLMHMERQNEEIRESAEQVKKWILPLSVVFLVLFGGWLFYGKYWDTVTILAFITGLILVIYLFYTGLSAAVICYVRRRGQGVYQGTNLFLLRQFASKVKTMRFTLGTLTALFLLTFLGSSIALMFSDFQNKMLEQKFPFDVHLYSGDPKDDFSEKLAVIRERVPVRESHTYQIWENNGDNQVNTWLYTHLRAFGDEYKNPDGTPDVTKIRDEGDMYYCDADTYLGLTDYNHLRKMLGYPEIALNDGEYAIHIKERVSGETGDFSDALSLEGTDGALRFAGYHTEPFSQDGHNGGDYVIVVPDRELARMQPYYAECAVMLEKKAPDGLKDALDAVEREEDLKSLDSYMEYDTFEENGNSCSGSDMIVVYVTDHAVRDNLIPEIKYLLSSVIFPMFYMGMVFLCVGLTVLSVHQLSDSAKYRFRYGVLKKLGLSRKEIAAVIRRQLALFYLCPALSAAGISGIIAGYVGKNFNFYTGIHASMFRYFGMSFALFFGIFLIYYIAAYVGFLRNIEGGER